MSNSVIAHSTDDLLVPQDLDGPVVLRLRDGTVDLHQRIDGTENLAVFVGGGDSYHAQRLPVAGRYQHEADAVTFRPTFGFVAGQTYTARIRQVGEPQWLAEFNIPRRTASTAAKVTAVYPSGSSLPENLLRFYVHFSVPMAPHLASDSVELCDELGVADDAAFMKFKQELWNEDRTRLTVLMDPSRIKRGVRTNLELGPALVEGHRYALTVNEGWPAADGSSALPRHSKSFVVAAALTEQPDIELWSWTSPRSGTYDALNIAFDRPFDRHLLREAVQITTKDGRPIEGTTHVGDNETALRFAPNEAWTPDELHVTVNGLLEDVAGNNFHELLDRDTNTASRRRSLTATAKLRPRP